MAFAVNPARVGVDFTKTDTSYPSAKLGEEVLGSDGITYKYCRAAAAKTAGYMYKLDYDSGGFTVSATGVVNSDASAAPLALVVPQTTTSAPDSGFTYAYAWYAVKGPLKIIPVYGPVTGADTELSLCSVAGQLLASTTGLAFIPGLKLTAAATAASTLSQAYAANALSIPSDTLYKS